MRESTIIEDELHVHFNSDQLIEPMIIPFYTEADNHETVACVPAKQVTGLLDISEDKAPVAIMAMRIGHVGIAAGYTSETLGRLIDSMLNMQRSLILEEKAYAQARI